MKYMLLIYMAENAMTDDERQHCYRESTDFAHELHAKGQFLATAPLQARFRPPPASRCAGGSVW